MTLDSPSTSIVTLVSSAPTTRPDTYPTGAQLDTHETSNLSHPMPDLGEFALGSGSGDFQQVLAVDRICDIQGFGDDAGHVRKGVGVNAFDTDRRLDNDPQERHRVGSRSGYRIQFQSRGAHHWSQ